jgi:group I intron endonuclease
VNSSPGVVYRITHRESGRCYIGQTVQSLAVRWRQHQKQSVCIRLHRAIVKHGPAAFDVEQIGASNDKLFLDFLERFWIGAHRSTDRAHGFNLRDGGSFGTHSEASKKRMSEKVRAAYERPETRERLRASKLGKPLPLETRERIAAANTGKRATDATKAILSERRKAIWQDPDKRKELLAAQAAGKARAKAAKA